MRVGPHEPHHEREPAGEQADAEGEVARHGAPLGKLRANAVGSAARHPDAQDMADGRWSAPGAGPNEWDRALLRRRPRPWRLVVLLPGFPPSAHELGPQSPALPAPLRLVA